MGHRGFGWVVAVVALAAGSFLAAKDAEAQACTGVTGFNCTFEFSGPAGSAVGQLQNLSGNFTPVALNPDGTVAAHSGDQFLFQNSTGTFSGPGCQLPIGPNAILSITEPAPGCIGVLIETIDPTAPPPNLGGGILALGAIGGAGTGIYFLTQKDKGSP